jgi:hypothetical protein
VPLRKLILFDIPFADTLIPYEGKPLAHRALRSPLSGELEGITGGKPLATGGLVIERMSFPRGTKYRSGNKRGRIALFNINRPLTHQALNFYLSINYYHKKWKIFLFFV